MLTWQQENHGMFTIRCMHIQKQKQTKIWNKILMMKMACTQTIVQKGLGLWCLTPLSTIFQLS